MLKLLTQDEFIHVWRACNGGTDPAMGLIYYLAQSQLMKLRRFQALSIEAYPKRCSELLTTISKYPREMETRLDKLPSDLLLDIALKISAKPHPVGEQDDPLWKGIASAAKVDVQSIANLDMPAAQSQQRTSMTMKFIELVNQKYPCEKIAWLAKGLEAIGKNNVLQNVSVFSECLKRGCVKITS